MFYLVVFPKRNLVLGDTTKNIKEVSSDRRAEAKLGPNPDVISWWAPVFSRPVSLPKWPSKEKSP